MKLHACASSCSSWSTCTPERAYVPAAMPAGTLFFDDGLYTVVRFLGIRGF